MHFPHYHCENGTSIIPYQTAMNVELAFVCSQLLSRLIFVALISLRRLKREELKDIFWKVVWNDRVYTLPPLLFYGLSVWRFVLFLLDEDHLGTYKAIARATISLYIFDDLTSRSKNCPKISGFSLALDLLFSASGYSSFLTRLFQLVNYFTAYGIK